MNMIAHNRNRQQLPAAIAVRLSKLVQQCLGLLVINLGGRSPQLVLRMAMQSSHVLVIGRAGLIVVTARL